MSIRKREKFLKLLAHASSVRINDGSGIVHEEQQVDFGIYIRDANLTGVRCFKCEAVFYDGSCSKIEYEYPDFYCNNGLSSTTGYICPNCLKTINEQVAVIKAHNLKEKAELGVK